MTASQPTPQSISDAEESSLRASIIHGLRMRGWGRIEAENEADDRMETLREAAAKAKESGL